MTVYDPNQEVDMDSAEEVLESLKTTSQLKTEVKAKEEPEKDEKVEVKEEVEEKAETAEEEDPVVAKARSMGWRPQDELEPGKEFIEPDEFVRNAKLFEKIDKYKKEVHELRGAIKELGSHMKKNEEVAYKKALKDVEAAKHKAIEEQDLEAYVEADKSFSELQKEVESHRPEEASDTLEISPEVRDFQARNKDWYNADTVENFEMSQFANTVDQFLAVNHPDMAPSDMLRTIELEVKKRYPHRFDGGEKKAERSKAPSPVASSNKPLKKERAQEGLSYSDLDDNQKKLYDLADSIPGFSKKEYLKQLEEVYTNSGVKVYE